MRADDALIQTSGNAGRGAERSAAFGSAGFSIVEMVMVLTLLGILMALVYPQVASSDYQTRAAMDAVGTTLLSAQQLAVTRQHDVVVSFDVTHDVIHIVYDEDSDGDQDSDEHVRSVALGDGITFGRGPAPVLQSYSGGPVTFTQTIDGRPAVTIHRSGGASETGVVYLTSVKAEKTNSRPQDAKAVEIVRASGRPSWYNYTSSSGWKRGF